MTSTTDFAELYHNYDQQKYGAYIFNRLHSYFNGNEQNTEDLIKLIDDIEPYMKINHLAVAVDILLLSSIDDKCDLAPITERLKTFMEQISSWYTFKLTDELISTLIVDKHYTKKLLIDCVQPNWRLQLDLTKQFEDTPTYIELRKVILDTMLLFQLNVTTDAVQTQILLFRLVYAYTLGVRDADLINMILSMPYKSRVPELETIVKKLIDKTKHWYTYTPCSSSGDYSDWIGVMYYH